MYLVHCLPDAPVVFELEYVYVPSGEHLQVRAAAVAVALGQRRSTAEDGGKTVNEVAAM